MAKAPSIPLSNDEWYPLFDALDIMKKVTQGRMRAEVIAERSGPATSNNFVGGWSEYLKIYNAADYHIATMHRITLADGTVPHEHGKDLRMGDVLLRQSTE